MFYSFKKVASRQCKTVSETECKISSSIEEETVFEDECFVVYETNCGGDKSQGSIAYDEIPEYYDRKDVVEERTVDLEKQTSLTEPEGVLKKMIENFGKKLYVDRENKDKIVDKDEVSSTRRNEDIELPMQTGTLFRGNFGGFDEYFGDYSGGADESYSQSSGCKDIPQKRCKKVPKTKKKSVPKKVCRQIPRRKCRKIVKQVPQKECNSVPKKSCQSVPKKKLQRRRNQSPSTGSPKKVPRSAAKKLRHHLCTGSSPKVPSCAQRRVYYFAKAHHQKSTFQFLRRSSQGNLHQKEGASLQKNPQLHAD